MRIKELEAGLKELRLSAFADKYYDTATQCAAQNFGHVDYLQMLVNAELEDRHHNRIKKLIQKSRLPRIKHLKDFNSARIPELTQGLVNELATGNFLDRAENLLIFGNPGTGKTHLAIALVQEWCNRGRKAIFITAAELIQELLKAKRLRRLNEYIKSINKNEAIVIDDISYVACDKCETDLLFLLLASRYENRSLIITSNLSFGEWGSIFKDDITTKAAVDRLVHHSTILKLNAESYRKESAKKKQEVLQQEATYPQ